MNTNQEVATNMNTNQEVTNKCFICDNEAVVEYITENGSCVLCVECYCLVPSMADGASYE